MHKFKLPSKRPVISTSEDKFEIGQGCIASDPMPFALGQTKSIEIENCENGFLAKLEGRLYCFESIGKLNAWIAKAYNK